MKFCILGLKIGNESLKLKEGLMFLNLGFETNYAYGFSLFWLVRQAWLCQGARFIKHSRIEHEDSNSIAATVLQIKRSNRDNSEMIFLTSQ